MEARGGMRGEKEEGKGQGRTMTYPPEKISCFQRW